ncbi:MAG: hypothetical protein QNK92_13165 [Amylibacter sp.]
MEIVEQLLPGALGTIVALHGAHYARHWGFGTFFEAKVARELTQFVGRFGAHDLVLLGVDEGGVAASLILDLNDSASGSGVRICGGLSRRIGVAGRVSGVICWGVRLRTQMPTQRGAFG